MSYTGHMSKNSTVEQGIILLVVQHMPGLAGLENRGSMLHDSMWCYREERGGERRREEERGGERRRGETGQRDEERRLSDWTSSRKDKVLSTNVGLATCPGFRYKTLKQCYKTEPARITGGGGGGGGGGETAKYRLQNK